MTVHWLPVPYSNYMGFTGRLRAFVHFAFSATRKAASLPGDVILATSTPLTIAIPGILASRWQRIPMVFEVRDLWPDVPIAMGVLRNPVAIQAAIWLERLAYRLSTRVVTVAPGMKEAVSQRGVPADHITVIPNGCDFDVFHPEISNSLRARSRGIRILYMGTMGKANGVDYIPRLAHELHLLSHSAAVKFYLVGDGSERQAVEALAADLNVLDESVYFIGTLPKRDVARWVASADATIITYDGPEVVFRDSVSNKFFDSIAAGKPVIANYSGFVTLTAQAAGAGFIVNRDPAVAAVEVLRLVSDSEVLEKAGRAAGVLARERFSRERLAGQLDQVLREAVHGDRR